MSRPYVEVVMATNRQMDELYALQPGVYGVPVLLSPDGRVWPQRADMPVKHVWEELDAPNRLAAGDLFALSAAPSWGDFMVLRVAPDRIDFRSSIERTSWWSTPDELRAMGPYCRFSSRLYYLIEWARRNGMTLEECRQMIRDLPPFYGVRP